MAEIVPVQHLQAYQGDDWTDVADFTLTAGNITGAKVWLTVKRYPTDLDGAAIVQISTVASAAGVVTILDPTSAQFDIVHAAMAAIVPGTYYYDVQVLLVSGKLRTAARGRFEVLAEICRASA